jgi:hypothetical protein
MGRLDMNPDRLWSRVEIAEVDGCWLWVGAKSEPNGYGLISWAGRKTYAHRLAWELWNDRPVPPGRFVCHHCDNRLCIRPSHLFIGTHADNMADAVAKNRVHPGQSHGMARLTDAQVAEIHRLLRHEVRGSDIAHMFGVHKNTIYNIKKSRSWSHVG